MPSKIDVAKKQIMDRAENALRIIGNDLWGKAAKKAPMDEGTLQGSGVVDVERTAKGVEVSVSFSTPYAAAQHEGLDFHHPKKGEAKYLEGPFKEMLPRYQAALEKAVS